MKSTRTSSRKQQHVSLTISKDVAFRGKTAGFERWDFLHNALPELNLSDVDCSTSFLGKPLSFPLLVTGMTGGYRDAERINRALAEACARHRLALGVGSQRQALESTLHHSSYSVVRKAAPEIPVIGNIGAAEVAGLKDVAPIRKLADLIHADAFAVHLNPLQELLQPEGTPTFSGVLDGIAQLVRGLGIPVVVKEIGAGLSSTVVRRLLDVGVAIVDVAGAGGTSWAGVEILRRASGDRSLVEEFWDWGIPTVDAVRQTASLKDQGRRFTLIASGGIHSGLDMAKAVAFGADMTGAARPVLQSFAKEGSRGIDRLVEGWKLQFRAAMFLTGSRSMADLQRQQLVLR